MDFTYASPFSFFGSGGGQIYHEKLLDIGSRRATGPGGNTKSRSCTALVCVDMQSTSTIQSRFCHGWHPAESQLFLNSLVPEYRAKLHILKMGSEPLAVLPISYFSFAIAGFAAFTRPIR